MLVGQHTRRRGSVAIKQGDDWKGIFISEHSTPLEFGEQLWNILQAHWKCLDRFSKALLNCGYWQEYVNGGLCPFCGKFDVGQPNQISGHILQIFQENGPKSMAPDPESNWHNHLKPVASILSKNAKEDGLWIEWVYVIDPKTYTLDVLKAVRAEGSHRVAQTGRKWEQENYQYITAASCSLFHCEPNWNIIEQNGLNYADYYFQKFSTPPTIINPEGEN